MTAASDDDDDTGGESSQPRRWSAVLLKTVDVCLRAPIFQCAACISEDRTGCGGEDFADDRLCQQIDLNDMLTTDRVDPTLVLRGGDWDYWSGYTPCHGVKKLFKLGVTASQLKMQWQLELAKRQTVISISPYQVKIGDAGWGIGFGKKDSAGCRKSVFRTIKHQQIVTAQH